MNEFNETYRTLPGGWLSKPEAKLLWESARPVDGPILEVGCYLGRSTCLLAALGRPLYCVDPFAGFDSDDRTGEATRRQWMANVEAATGLAAVVVPAAMFGLNGVPAPDTAVTLWAQQIEDWRPRPVGFAYLDGDHTYGGTAGQVRKALECKAGMIAVHDVNDDGGGLEVKRACLDELGSWDARVERLAVWDLRGRR